MRKAKAKRSNPSDDARNLVRGALPMLRAISTPERVVDTWLQEQLAHQQIKKAFAVAKKRLSKTAVIEFEHWVANTVGEQNRAMMRLGTNLTSLGLLPSELTSQSLVTELRLASDQLVRQRSELLDFADCVTAFQDSFIRRDWHGAKAVLDSVTTRHGHSYWAIEGYLGVTQAVDGVEALKAKVTSMTISASGANKFLIYHFGVRNEPAQTAARFKVNIKKRIDESHLSLGLNAYFKYRLYGELDLNEARLADILASEQLTTTIDLLFTVIKVLRLIYTRRDAFSLSVLDAAQAAEFSLMPVTSKLGLHQHNETTERQSTGESPAVDLSLSSVGFNPPTSIDLDSLACTALFNLMKSQGQDDLASMDVSRLIIDGLMSRLSTRSDGVLGEDLAKAQLNFNTVPQLIQLGDVSEIPPLPSLFLGACTDTTAPVKHAKSIRQALLNQIRLLLSGDNVLLSHSVSMSVLAEAWKLHKAEKSEVAITSLIHDRSSVHGVVAEDAFLVIGAHLQHESGDLTGCIRTTSKAGRKGDKLLPLLPLAELFQSAKWSSLRRVGPSVDLSICLDLFLKTIDDRKVRTFKRYSVEELMKVHNCDSIINLTDVLLRNGSEVASVEYFAYYVCDVYTVELLPGMSDSRKVQLARAHVLRKLSELRTSQELAYLQEALAIDELLSVNDGLNVLDDSKVYVDEKAVLNAVNKELEADFQRYLKLVESGLGTSDSFSTVLQNLKNVSAKTFQIPKNDADDLFAEVVSSIREKFLFDPASGLDIIVSRRIRHGTIQGELRGQLEAVGLIGQRPRVGANYDPSDKVVSVCSKMDAKKRRVVFAAFSRFSESIDQLVALLRDEYFHATSKNKSRGIFDVQISAVMLALARSVAQTCQSIEEFSKQCLAIFWFLMSVKVSASRPAIEAETKKTLASIFSKLTNELRSVGVDDVSFYSEVQKASEELQRRASVIASWIRVPKVSIEGNTYSMRQVVDVTVAMVSGQRAGFTPIVTAKVPDDLELDSHGFSLVVDALYIALDNICQHSGKKISNNVSIEVRFNIATSLISFTVISEVASNARTTEKEARLNAIRADIQRRAYGERARLDRGSGLFKLAALVMQSETTRISFFYNEESKFELHFDLVFVASIATSRAQGTPEVSIPDFIQELSVEG